MKILVITQKVDVEDPVLGFFHGWILEFAKHFEFVTVIALGVGQHNLPNNVKVLSLGKESGASKIKYLVNFYRYVWRERKNYDAVFVHMNQEYILLAGLWWRLIEKKVVMWRNHHAGSWLTDVAAFFCNKVFCTSKYSYTAKYKKTVLMPVGVDVDLFKPEPLIIRKPNSILFLARMSSVKKPHVLMEALKLLKDKSINFTAGFYGDALPKDQDYYAGLQKRVKEMGLESEIKFFAGVPNIRAVEVFNQYQVFVNLSSSGMYDKTIFEAIACGLKVVACNKNLQGVFPVEWLFKEDDPVDLAGRLEKALLIGDNDQAEVSRLREWVLAEHSLYQLVIKLKNIYGSSK